MAVYKTNASPYWKIQFQFKGKTYIKSSKSAVKAVAQRMETEWKAQLHGQTFFNEKERIKVRTMIEDYINGPIAGTTRKNSNVVYRSLDRFTNLDVYADEFSQKEFVKWIESRRRAGVKESTLRTNCLVIMGMWNRTNKKIYNVPELQFQYPKQQAGKIDYLTEQEEADLIAKLQSRKPHAGGTGDWRYEMHDLILIGLETGARYNEICLLEWSNIDLKNRTINLWRKKTSTESYIHMTNLVHQILTRRSENKIHPKWVFTNKERNNHRTLNSTHVNKVMKDLGCNHTFHALRHTLATKLIKNGFTLAEVQRLLGHNDIKTTLRYAHLESADASKKAVQFLNNQRVQANRSQLKVV